MSRIQPALIGKTPFERLLGHDEDVMRQWTTLGDTLTDDRKLSTELKEQVRRTLAQQNGCDYCRAKGRPDPETYDERTALAVGFADVFLNMKGKTPASSIRVLQETFTDAEISELCAFIAFMTASQYVGAMLGLERENPLTST
ncbi:carboxymuconolactone decarboxylase family protein [Exiguobacterium sp.]|uniref:carboxymuconolactone decarboxylase family protein n=1 Tax=Exiguobacterium sp. TaxID=44751 RepID=UPI00263AB9FD|nr:carboxymuconolactone decarboxylase family protein [Exiguobacterium sp.]MCC5891262.1 carboxymuconolactone decarboxylase family protein [Exiguobacterium sp.]